MTGLVVLGAGLVQVAVLTSVWCAWEVATTDGYLLELEGHSKRRWLALAWLPLLGPACWIEVGRPPPGVAPVVPRRRRLDAAP